MTRGVFSRYLWLLAFFFCGHLHGEIVVSVVSSSTPATELPIANGGRFVLGSFASGNITSITLRIRNTSAAPAQIVRYSALGTGFQLIAPNVPFPIAGNATRDAILKFTATAAASYSANLQIDSCASTPGVDGCPTLPMTTFLATLLANGVQPPTLTVFPVCTGQDPNTVLYGSVQRGLTRVCNYNLMNPTTQPMIISTFSVTGGGFSTTQPRSVPFTLAAGQTISFAIQFTNTLAGVQTGTLQIESQTYILTATNIDPPLPKPIIEFDSQNAASSQQRRVSMRLPSPSPFTASGVMKMTLIADSAAVTDDAAVTFATGLRQVTFTVQEGSSDVLLGGQTSAMFQTGTSSGKIRFTLSGIATGFASDPTTDLVIPRAPIVIDQSLTGRVDGFLYLRLIGYDNTFTAGTMSFSFYDVNGALIQTVPANFLSNFQTYFSGTQTGGVFEASLQFPVNNAASAITSVEAQLTNGAGIVLSGRILF